MSNYFARNRDEYEEELPTVGQSRMIAEKLVFTLAAALCLGVLIVHLGISVQGACVADLREVLVGSLLAMLVGLLVVTAWRDGRGHKVIGGIVILIIVLGIDQALQLYS